MWICTQGHMTKEPDQVPTQHPAGYVYTAPCCMVCGCYFTAEQIEDAEQNERP